MFVSEKLPFQFQLDDEQWQRAMEYVNGVSELNYMTQIVIMLYEDPTKVRTRQGRRTFPEIETDSFLPEPQVTQMLVRSFILQDFGTEGRFHIELHFSPGAYTLGSDKNPAGRGYRSQYKKEKSQEKKVREVLSKK